MSERGQPLYLREDEMLIPRAHHEALMAAAIELADNSITKVVMTNGCSCKWCKKRRSIIDALRAAGVQIEGK